MAEESVNNYPLNSVEDRVDQAETDIDGNSSDIQGNTQDISELRQALMPIAGVTAWDKAMTSEGLPEGFVECNGQTVNDAESPLDGQSVPDLNGNNRLLKGNSSSGGTGSFNTDGDNTSNTENTYNVVWVMRVK